MRAALPLDRRRQKYGAQPTTVDGIRFASKAEAARYQELRLLEKAGEIRDIEVQPVFPLCVGLTGRIGEYRADFAYLDTTGRRIVEDVKSPATRTELYRWKIKHLQAEYWKTVGVELPSSIVAIIHAAGGADPKQGGMPYAMASILGALPWIAVALYQQLPPEEYAAFAGQVKANMQQAWQIIGHENPPAEFDATLKAAMKQVQ